MKKVSLFIFLSISFQSFGQVYPNLNNLAKELINDKQSDSLNLASIFNWITDNIEYDSKTYYEGLDYPEFDIDIYLDSASYQKAYNHEVSEMVITNKKAICDGYSRLFLTLCDYAGIKCQYISGQVKFPLRDEISEHAWNAVFLNGKWNLIDLTWASGGLVGFSFVKEKEMFFYFTPPDQLIYDHYPDELKWSLLDSMTVKNLISNCPIRSHQPFKSGLIAYFPKNKNLKIDTNKLFKICIEFNRKIELHDISISGSPTETLADELGVEITRENYDSLINIHPDLLLAISKIEIINTEVNGNKYEFTIKASSSNLKRINVYIESSWPSLVYDVKF